MAITAIGQNIAQMRREKAVTQEALAAAVGVTGQAVSKWESGGSPDIELLPAIADFFEVSIDCLFGRDALARMDLRDAMLHPLYEATDDHERFDIIMDYLWQIQQALVHSRFSGLDDPVRSMDEAYTFMKSFSDDYHRTLSEVIVDAGMSRVRLGVDRRYFLFMPRPKNGWKFDLEKKYTKLFADLADEAFLKTLLFFHSRDMKPFTISLLERELGFNNEQALAMIDRLRAYALICDNELELDDSAIHYYDFSMNPAIVPFLFLAEDIIKKSSCYYGQIGSISALFT